jgi:hypothetical protein
MRNKRTDKKNTKESEWRKNATDFNFIKQKMLSILFSLIFINREWGSLLFLFYFGYINDGKIIYLLKY